MEDQQPHSTWKARLRKPLPYLLAGGTAAVLSVLIYASFQFVYAKRAETLSTSAQGVLDNPASAAALGPEGSLLKKTSESFRLVAKKVGPAVVNIK
jgi:hypothetical protein